MIDGVFEVRLLRVEGSEEQEAGNAALGLDTCQDFVVNAVEQTRHRAKDGGAQFSDIVKQFGRVTLPK